MKIFAILSLVYTFKLQDTIGLLSSMTGLQNVSTDMLANQLTKLILKNTDYKYPIETVKFPKIRTQRIELVTIDNIVINAYLLAPKVINKDTTAAIILHGIGTNRENFIIDHKLYNMVKKHNMVLLVPDYRDFGDSEGNFTIEGCTYDVDACCKFMRLILGLEQVNIIGFSFGTGTALEYIKRSNNIKKWVIATNKPDVKLHRIDSIISKKSVYRFVAVDSDCNFYVKVVLLGSFSNFVNVMERDLNIYEVVTTKFSFILNYLKEFLPYDNEDAIKTIHRKNVLLLHGKNDTTLCDWHCKKLAAVSGAEYVLYNETHDGLVDTNEVWTKILSFFRIRK